MEGKKIKCNVVLMGKSGAGKSSFANYLFGEEIFTSGIGKPVTKWEENFQDYAFEREEINLNVYDTVGLEADNYRDWKSEIDSFLSKSKYTSDPFDKIHGIFYVINSASGRIDDVEVNLINDFLNKNIPLHIILTNIDSASEEKVVGIENAIKRKSNVKMIYHIVSVERKKRGGILILPQGKEEVLKGFLYEAGRIIALSLLENLLNDFNKLNYKMKSSIDNADLTLFNISNWDEQFDNLTENFDNHFENFEYDIEKFINFSDSFGMEFKGNSYLDELLDLEKLEDYSEEIEKKLNSITADLDSDSILDNIKGIFKVGYCVVTIKSQIKEIFDGLFRTISLNINTTKKKIEKIA